MRFGRAIVGRPTPGSLWIRVMDAGDSPAGTGVKLAMNWNGTEITSRLRVAAGAADDGISEE
jgi:hypothetical protein